MLTTIMLLSLTLGACTRVTVVVLCEYMCVCVCVCVCVSVTELADTYLVYLLKARSHQAFCAALKVCIICVDLVSENALFKSSGKDLLITSAFIAS